MRPNPPTERAFYALFAHLYTFCVLCGLCVLCALCAFRHFLRFMRFVRFSTLSAFYARGQTLNAQLCTKYPPSISQVSPQPSPKYLPRIMVKSIMDSWFCLIFESLKNEKFRGL